MNSELDSIKSTITISLGMKNKLRELKGSMSYEKFINYLIRQHESEPVLKNYVEIQSNKRKLMVYSPKGFDSFKIVFSYNPFSKSQNYQFDILIEKIRENGKVVSFDNFFNQVIKKTSKSFAEVEFRTYFELLSESIKRELDHLFKHNGRFEDHFSWKSEFKVLNLSEKCFEEDVLQKLNNFKRGLHYDD